MTRATRHSVSRMFEEMPDGSFVKRERKADPISREIWKCPDCGKEHYVSIGQRINCKHNRKT